MNRDSFTETGAGDANLQVAKQSDTLVTLQPAIEFGGERRLDNGWLLRPYLRVGATQLLTDNNWQIAATLQGAPSSVAPFTVETEVDQTYADVSVGANILSK